MNSLKVLPLLVIVALLSFAIRFGEFAADVKTREQFLNPASIAAEEAHGGSGEEGDTKAESIPVPAGLPDSEPAPMPENAWADPATIDMQFSETQTTVLKELKERRDALDAREGRINQREALLKVTEQRVEEKITELDQIRGEIKDLLGQQSEEEEARLLSLVKIYEGMKPKEAAAIFDNLNMDILLQVVGRMSERRSAPIIASMNVQKAQELTTLLAEQKKLPELPEG